MHIELQFFQLLWNPNISTAFLWRHAKKVSNVNSRCLLRIDMALLYQSGGLMFNQLWNVPCKNPWRWDSRAAAHRSHICNCHTPTNSTKQAPVAMEKCHGVIVATLLVSPLYQEGCLSGQDWSRPDSHRCPLKGSWISWSVRHFCQHSSLKCDGRGCR